jgi:hypothetical protein
VTDPPLIPGSVYGLRTWRIAYDDDGEYLTAIAKDVRWPDGGAWLEASCAEGHDHSAPAPDCTCGVHAWHPRESSARRVLAGRFEQPGIVEAAGAIELQHDGFRAERARPYAFVVTPSRNAHLAERLAHRYGARVARVKDAAGLLAWCRERGLGLDPATVDDLLGPDHASERLQAEREHRQRTGLRVAAAVVVGAGLFAAGWAIASGPNAGPIYGRTGRVHPPKCVKVTLPGTVDTNDTANQSGTHNDC